MFVHQSIEINTFILQYCGTDARLFLNYYLYLPTFKVIENMLKSLFHWKVLLNIILAAVIFIGVVWLTFRWLELHTNHGKEIPVPNVMNKTVHEAIKVLDDVGLEYEVDSFKFDPKYKPFQVLDIFPKPGARVKGGRTIMLKVNPRTWAKVTVPDILDKYKGLAFLRLDQVGLQVGDTIYEPNIQRDAVIRMMFNGTVLKPGTQLERFSTIDLVIGAGPKRNIGVPNLVGLSVAEAKAIISNNLFETGLIEHEDGKNDPSDIVYYQDPVAGSLRDQGMQIDLWASKKSPSEMGSRIAYLNSIYRIKIDTTLPPVRYEEIPAFEEPVFEPKPHPETPAPTGQSTTPGATPSQPRTGNGGAQSNTPAANKKTETSTTKPAATVPDKPKARKVVVE